MHRARCSDLPRTESMQVKPRGSHRSPSDNSSVRAKLLHGEKQEMEMIRHHSPLVETYIQKVRITENDGSWIPDGDHYFIGRAEFAKGLELKALPAPGDTSLHHMVAGMTRLFDFGTEFLPLG